jgi:predicted DNA binding CopG/RHH family protein
MKPVQFFEDDYLEQCKTFSTEAILNYLDNFRMMQQSTDKTRLISIKISESLLASFRAKSELHQVKYQTQIKKLMTDWVNNQNNHET